MGTCESCETKKPKYNKVYVQRVHRAPPEILDDYKVKRVLVDHYDPNKNYIVAEFLITDGWVNDDVRIINSYEEQAKMSIVGHPLNEIEYINEKEITKCQITINDQPIPFSYFHKFPEKGIYVIKYYFNNYLTKTNHMFRNCANLKNIDLCNFHTHNVTNMDAMFHDCVSLVNINFDKINTLRVNYMNQMFAGCTTLRYINMPTINTINVVNMDDMFHSCISLQFLDVITNDKRTLKQLKKDLDIIDDAKSI